jgi:plastocyanin
MRCTVLLTLLAGVLLASTASAGRIRGSVAIRGFASDSSTQQLSDAVIYVEKVPDKVERKLTGSGAWFFWKPTQPRVASVVQKGRRFHPRVLAVALGTPVAFRNLDNVYHATFSVSAAKRFDLGRNMPGRSDTLVFGRPGIINIHCDIHPDMLGYVVVTPNHVFTRPDASGEYRLPKLPAGTYRVHAFHPRRGEIQRTAEMPKRGDVNLDLTF